MKDSLMIGPNRSCPDAGVEMCPSDRDVYLCQQVKTYLARRSEKADLPAPLAEAWDLFYRQHAPRIRAFLDRSALPEADREDCLQGVWIEVVAHLASLSYDPGRGSLSAWLLAVARNRSVDMLRRRGRRPDASRTGDVDSLVDPRPGPVADCERDSMRERVTCVLAELAAEVSEVNYRVFHRRMIDDRPGAEVAAELGLTPEQVRFRLHRMKRKFRELFERPPVAAAGRRQSGRDFRISAQRMRLACE